MTDRIAGRQTESQLDRQDSRQRVSVTARIADRQTESQLDRQDSR